MDSEEHSLRKTQTPSPSTRIPIILCDGASEQILNLGICEGATAGFDMWLDFPLPPSHPSRSALGYLAYKGPGGQLMTDVRAEGATWQLSVLQPAKLILGADYRLGRLQISGRDFSIFLGGGQGADLQPGVYSLTWSSSENYSRPLRTALGNLQPNPFNSTMEITAELAVNEAMLQIFDLAGREVKQFALAGTGTHRIRWDACADDGYSLSSGIYFVRLLTNNKVIDSRKALLVK